MSVIETTRTVTDTMYVCDICGKQSNFMHRCCYCNRHICNDHVAELIEHNYITGEYEGDCDNYERVCHDCYQIIHTGEIARLIDEYRKEARILDGKYIIINNKILEQTEANKVDN